MPLAIVVLLAVIAVLSYLLWRFYSQAQNYRRRFTGIVDKDAELASLQNKLQDATRAQKQVEADNEAQRRELSADYDSALAKYRELQKEISVLEENLEDLSFGLYKPHFTFDSPEEYKTALSETRDKERQMIRDNRATTWPKEWTVNNSKREGQRMVRLNAKLACGRSMGSATLPLRMSHGTMLQRWRNGFVSRLTQ